MIAVAGRQTEWVWSSGNCFNRLKYCEINAHASPFITVLPSIHPFWRGPCAPQLLNKGVWFTNTKCNSAAMSHGRAVRKIFTGAKAYIISCVLWKRWMLLQRECTLCTAQVASPLSNLSSWVYVWWDLSSHFSSWTSTILTFSTRQPAQSRD